jgi:beta-galactosidase GanA
MSSVHRPFTVNGQPFFSLGGQARNSSGYNRSEAETAFRAVKLLRGNTLEIPVYWEQVEPEEGTFDWSSVDTLLAMAREYGIRLVLLWFGTWKNGNMEYVPAWVKRAPERFQRVINPYENPVWVLSSHCEANYEADRSAFTGLMAHLGAHDAAERTVIAVQIENEPGILGSDRDYGAEAQAMFEGTVPASLIAKVAVLDSGDVFDAWKAAGARRAGTWTEVFGPAASEFMTATSIAQYIDRLAVAGRAVYDIPMYGCAKPAGASPEEHTPRAVRSHAPWTSGSGPPPISTSSPRTSTSRTPTATGRSVLPMRATITRSLCQSRRPGARMVGTCSMRWRTAPRSGITFSRSSTSLVPMAL